MIITFRKSSLPGCYHVSINGRPAGRIMKESATPKTYWIYQCGGLQGQPTLQGTERTRYWAVRQAVLEPLYLADDIKEYFTL